MILRAITRGARQGRKEDTWTLLATHSYLDIQPLHGLTANAGLRIIGKQEGDISSLIRDSGFSAAAKAAIDNVRNVPGGAHQFVLAWDSGANMKVEVVSVALSPMEYWTHTSTPIERNARMLVASLTLPGEPLINAIAWLGHNFPNGLASLGLEEIPDIMLADLAVRRAAWEAAQVHFAEDSPDEEAWADAALEAAATEASPLNELQELADDFLLYQERARELAAAAGAPPPHWAVADATEGFSPAATCSGPTNN